MLLVLQLTLCRGKSCRHRPSVIGGNNLSPVRHGRYSITSNRNLTTCAAVGTRGSVNSVVPFSPATIEIVAGPNTSSIGIQVRTLLFFGGGFINQSFHAALIC